MMLYGWQIFLDAYQQARRKKHGKGKREFWAAIYIATCAQYLVDHQHRKPGRLPWWGRVAQYFANMAFERSR